MDPKDENGLLLIGWIILIGFIIGVIQLIIRKKDD